MAHINNTLVRKRLAKDAMDEEKDYNRYMEVVSRAVANGYPKEAIINELEDEILAITHDKRDGDALFQEGLWNTKMSCINAIKRVIEKLKEEK